MFLRLEQATHFMAIKHILHVEDEAKQRDAMAAYLKGFQKNFLPAGDTLELTQCSNLAQAMTQIAGKDAVITDGNLTKDTDSWEGVEIAKQAIVQNIPVAIYTGNTKKCPTDQLGESGTTWDLFQKPAELGKVIDWLKNTLAS